MLKNPPANAKAAGDAGQEDSPGGGYAAHSSVLACKNPQTEEPGRLQSMGSQRVRHDCGTFHFTSLIFLVIPR